MPNFCLTRIRPLIRVRSPPPQSSLQSQNYENPTAAGDEEKKDYAKDDDSGEKLKATVSGRRIMIVVDSSIEAKNAVQWALSHTVQNQDAVILLHVVKPSSSKQGWIIVRFDFFFVVGFGI